MNQKLKFIGLLAILPLALMALTPDFIGEADAASSQRNDANNNNAGDTNESQPIRHSGTTDEDKDTSAKNLAKGQN